MTRRPHWTTAAVLVLALGGSLLAAGAAQRVRDANEERLLAQRAEAMAQVVAGLGGTFEADLVAAAAVARDATVEEFTEYVTSSSSGDLDGATWALLVREGDGVRAEAVLPPGGLTYFDTPGLPGIDAQLQLAFDGEFVVTGIFGEGMGRRMGIAAGVPGLATERVAYAEFPLVAVAASSPDATDDTLFDGVDLALYVGREPSEEGLIFGTFPGAVPDDAVTARLAAGGVDVVVAVAAKKPLSGELADSLPMIVFGFGISIGVLAALLVEMSRRKQQDAMQLARELQAKHAALEVAIEEQQRAEDGLREAQRKEVVGELAGGIAHDFNNLLAVITSYAELAGDRVSDPGVRADLVEIRGAAERGAALVRRLLQFAREDSTGTVTSDINVVVHDLARLLERTVGEDVALVVDLTADPAVVPVTTTELEQVVVNLVVNARHAIRDGGLISVRSRTDHDAGTVVLEVADDGVGMDADVAARAFEPLFSTRARDEGTGLGLATVASIARRAGGIASIDSAPGKGTTVRVVLPIAADGVEDEQPAGGDAIGEDDERITVLLVEDEEAVRRAMRRMLEARGFRVHESTSGLDAVERYLDTTVPDLLVTDVVMPGGMNGREVAARFRTRIPDLPVVFVSGYAGGMTDEQLAEGGPVRVVSKPFTATGVEAAVTGVLADRVATPQS